MPAVVVLRCETSYHDGTIVEGGCELGGVEEFLDGEAEAFDPVLCGEVDGGESCQTAVCWGGDNEILFDTELVVDSRME